MCRVVSRPRTDGRRGLIMLMVDGEVGGEHIKGRLTVGARAASRPGVEPFSEPVVWKTTASAVAGNIVGVGNDGEGDGKVVLRLSMGEDSGDRFFAY